MRTVEISTASEPLSAYAEELGEETIVLTLHEEPIAAIVSLKGVDRESAALGANPEFMSIVEKVREEFRTGRKLSLKEMKRQVLQ